MLYLRSLAFLVWFVLFSVVTHLACSPTILLGRRAAMWSARLWGELMLWGLKHIALLDYEVRGREHLPSGGVIVASKHLSMWETVAFLALLSDPAMVLKRELLAIPFYGWYARAQDMIPIDRQSGVSAMRLMLAAARRALALGRQIVIFPEGTRRKLDDPPDYKPGVAGLYAQLGVSCVPVAHNSGVFWTAGGLLKKPGTIVLEFLEPIPPDLPREEFMRLLQARIEMASRRLIAEGRTALAARGLA